MKTDETLAEVAVSGPLRQTFIYRLPDTLERPQPGQRVLVPFGRTRKAGYYIAPAQPRPGLRLKSVIRLLDPQSYFSDDLFRLCLWLAEYYFANPADCFTAALPTVFKGKSSVRYRCLREDDELNQLSGRKVKPGDRISGAVIKTMRSRNEMFHRLLDEGVIEEDWRLEKERSASPAGYRAAEIELFDRFFKRRKTGLAPFDTLRSRAELKASGWTDYLIREAVKAKVLIPEFNNSPAGILDFIESRVEVQSIRLNGEQQTVVDELSKTIDDGFSVNLLHGVTGSGKTIVYCHLCRTVIENGKTALVLTPEIALAGRTLAYFRGFFGDQVTILHSAMTAKERFESWRGIRSGRFKLVIGPRSALFAPLEKLGLIVVDEEHDSSYKQDNPSPRFHGRDAAVMRARINNIPILLGSASPSFESYTNAKSGRYRLFHLSRRPREAKLPIVHIVDMRKERLKGNLAFFSLPLKQHIESRISADEQVILYLNRRGHSPRAKCLDCGFVPSCSHCRVNLTYHRSGNRMSCHYCGRVEAVPKQCPECGSGDIMFLGVGTQKVEDSLPRFIENVRVARFDSDSASGRQNAHRILAGFASGESNLLLGTQMVTKGLDFPKVTLVGVMSADSSLDLPDFRASEKTFARLLQVAGRAGRAEQAGEVLIQTFNPDNELIDDAARQDYDSFYDREIRKRKALDYPPFSRLVNFTLSGKSESLLEKSALQFRDRFKEKLASGNLSRSVILGPAPCPLYRLRGMYRRHLFIKTHEVVKLVRMLTVWELSEPRFKLPSGIKLAVDVDPEDMM